MANDDGGNPLYDPSWAGWWSRLLAESWFNVLLTLITFAFSTWLAIYLYRKSDRRLRLKHVIADIPLLGTTEPTGLEGLEIRYNGRPVPRVTGTSFGLWNAGNYSIRDLDIVGSDPLRLVCREGAEILSASVTSVSRSVIGARIVEAAADNTTFSFDFLDKGDAFTINVIHTGSPGAIAFAGTVRGLPQGAERHEPYKHFLRIIRLAIAISLLAAVGYLVFMAYLVIAAGNWKLISLAALTVVAVIWASRPPKVRQLRGVPQVITDNDLLFAAMNGPAQDAQSREGQSYY